MPSIRTIPEDMVNDFTMNGKAKIFDWYLDGTDNSSTLNWSTELIDSYISKFSIEHILNDECPSEPYYHGALYHYKSIQKYPIENMNVAVIGSQTPWIEAILINMGAKHITTVEYNVPICNDPRITCISYEEFSTLKYEYDAIFSYSSIEHSGLGRYGDKLDPYGDFKSLLNIRESLKYGGLLYLGIPVGKDSVVFNAHRVYGYHRLNIVNKIFGGKYIDWICDIKESYLDNCVPHNNGPQPILIYKHNSEIPSVNVVEI